MTPLFPRTLTLTTLCAAALLTTAPTWAADVQAASAQVTGEKIDSGLGDLPHYRLWADPSGKAPMRRAAVVAAAPANVAGAKQDSGLGDLPHFKHWGHRAGVLSAVQVSQAR